MKHRSFDVLGNVVVVNFPDDMKSVGRRKFAGMILKDNKSVRTVLAKVGKFKGRLRKMETLWVAGEKTKEVLYKENGCSFRFNIDTTYFSPRLSNERKEIAGKIKKGDEVLVMFAGVAPFSIVIAKNSGARKVFSNEINREANKYAKLNVELNNLKSRVELLPGDAKRIAVELAKQKKKFDVVVMPRPQLRDSFLKEAFAVSKKGTRIYYYDFCDADKTEEIVEKIKIEASRAKKKIKIAKVKSAGEIGPYKIRCRIDFIVG